MSSKSVSVYLFGSPSPVAKLDLTSVVNVGALLATHGSYFLSAGGFAASVHFAAHWLPAVGSALEVAPPWPQ